jgi:hypothetical protein
MELHYVFEFHTSKVSLGNLRYWLCQHACDTMRNYVKKHDVEGVSKHDK